MTLFKKGNLVRYEKRDGSLVAAIVLSWEASEEWVEVLFADNTAGWVRAATLEIISESR